MAQTVHSEPLSVDGESGEVMLHGAPGMALSLTPEAARLTSELLNEGADNAEGSAATKVEESE
ncbi:MAG: hypothetical protein V4530_15410 [Pseudomonadota bacterium]